jgi:DNA-binding MarR family transcriptional regulator
MKNQTTHEQNLALAFAASWNLLEKRLDRVLGAIRGISFAEYRLLRALSDAPNAWASRVDLAQTVGLTPSGVTRALRPMEKLGYVATAKSKRDARLALASLTPAGQDLVNDASGVVDDIMKTILERSPKIYSKLDEMIVLLEDFGGQAIQGIG